MDSEMRPIVRRIQRLAASCVVLTGSAFVVPRFLPNLETGLAGGATAILIFLAILTLALIVATYLLIVTLRHRESLSTGIKLIGIVPGVLLGTALVGLVWLLRF